MVKVIGKLSTFRGSRVLLVGDFMLDTYTTGAIRRISPEAPVPVLHDAVLPVEHRPVRRLFPVLQISLAKLPG